MGEITVFFYWTVYTIYEQDTTFCGCSNTMDFPAKEEKQKKAKQSKLMVQKKHCT